MKKLFTLFFILFSLPTFCQTRMPAYTLGAMRVIHKDLEKNGGSPSGEILNRFPVSYYNGGYFIPVLCKINSSFNRSAAQESGIYTGAIAGNIASMRIPLDLFTENFQFPGITYMEAAEKTEPLLDGAVPDTRADSVHMGINLPQSYTGNNVIVGVVDWGFDYSHPVFYDTALSNYRVLAAWDQAKLNGPAPAGFSYGTVYNGQTELLAAQADTFSLVSNYHGTHVAGIAGGAGAGLAYRGTSFASDLLFCQMAGNSAYSVDAYQWMVDIAQAAGKRLVINNSFGAYRNNPLDGTSLMSQAIESYIDSGVVFVISAGNNSGTNFHIKKTFNADSVKTRINGFAYTSDTILWGQTVTMWGESGNIFSTRLRILGTFGQLLVQTPYFNTQTAVPYLDTFLVTGSDTIWYIVTTDAAHPLNGRPQMTLDVRCLNPDFKCMLISEASSGTVHYWNTRKTIYNGGNWGNAFSSYLSGSVGGDSNYGIGHPGITSGAITVAAHVTNGGITSFSSTGPRMDDYQKPDISAPGNNITSSLNSYSPGTFSPVDTVNFNSRTYGFIKLSGTSMAGPMVTGIVALMLEADPTATADDIKGALKTTARQDTYTGIIPPTGSVRWGFGKVDAYTAVVNLITGIEEAKENSHWFIFPNPAGDVLHISGEMTGKEKILIYSADGKLVSEKPLLSQSITISGLPQGMYVLKITNTFSTDNFRIMVLR